MVKKGYPFKFNFSYKGKPKPIISWRHNGELLDLGDTNMILKPSTEKKGYGETIIINTVDYHHKGYYQAVAENWHGKDVIGFYIHVIGK